MRTTFLNINCGISDFSLLCRSSVHFCLCKCLNTDTTNIQSLGVSDHRFFCTSVVRFYRFAFAILLVQHIFRIYIYIYTYIIRSLSSNGGCPYHIGKTSLLSHFYQTHYALYIPLSWTSLLLYVTCFFPKFLNLFLSLSDSSFDTLSIGLFILTCKVTCPWFILPKLDDTFIIFNIHCKDPQWLDHNHTRNHHIPSICEDICHFSSQLSNVGGVFRAPAVGCPSWGLNNGVCVWIHVGGLVGWWGSDLAKVTWRTAPIQTRTQYMERIPNSWWIALYEWRSTTKLGLGMIF